jgi:membrane associated rhomboid family serine protease
MVLMLMVANVAVYMLWQKADPTFMRDHFTVSGQKKAFASISLVADEWRFIGCCDEQISLENVSSGRLYTLLTNAFSHAEPPQLFSNMMCLYFFGSSVRSSLLSLCCVP